MGCLGVVWKVKWWVLYLGCLSVATFWGFVVGFLHSQALNCVLQFFFPIIYLSHFKFF